MQSSIEVEWVLGQFTGDYAKSVLAHAAASISYKIVQQGKDRQVWVIAAFRRPTNTPLPPHLTRVTDPIKIARLEGRLA